MANLSLRVAEEAWRVAREGMVPEDDFNRAQEYNIQSMIDAGKLVKVPPVEEWPEWAGSICLEFHEGKNGGAGGVLEYKVFPRPIPKWTPGEGEPVFVKDGDQILVGRYVVWDGRHRVINNGIEMSYYRNNVKPFDASMIGCNWEDI